MTRLDHVVIAVSDWERSNDFYVRVLGAELLDLESIGIRDGAHPLHPMRVDKVQPSFNRGGSDAWRYVRLSRSAR